MYQIVIEQWFSSSHRLLEHPGTCKNLHGHNFRVLVTVESNQLNEQGMVLDFLDLEKALRNITDCYDHQMLNSIPPFDKIPPTAENLARVIAEKLEKSPIFVPNIRVKSVQIFETDEFSALWVN